MPLPFILFFGLLSVVPLIVLPAYTLYKFYKAEYISFFRAFRLGVYTGLVSCASGILGALIIHFGNCGIENFGSTGDCDPHGGSGWLAFPYIIFAIPVGFLVFIMKLVQEYKRRKHINGD